MTNNQPNPAQGQKKEIKIADNIPGAEYSNIAQFGTSREEILLKFMNLAEGAGRVVGKIIVSPGHFKRMVNAMNGVLKSYEEKFGEIKEAEGPGSKEIGFKG